MYICTHIFVCMCVYSHTHIYTYIYIYTYTHIHTCTHTYIYIHTHMVGRLQTSKSICCGWWITSSVVDPDVVCWVMCRLVGGWTNRCLIGIFCCNGRKQRKLEELLMTSSLLLACVSSRVVLRYARYGPGQILCWSVISMMDGLRLVFPMSWCQCHILSCRVCNSR